MNGMIQGKNGAWRRTDIQIRKDMEDMLVLSLQGYSDYKIADMLSEQREYPVTRSMIRKDIVRAKKELSTHFLKLAEAAFALEMKRIDVMEQEAWRHFRVHADQIKVEEVIEEMNDNGDLTEKTIKTISSHSPYALGWYREVVKCHQERRRILRMYAPEHVTLIQNQNVTPAKAYVNWNPGESWPSAPDQPAIPGEIVD